MVFYATKRVHSRHLLFMLGKRINTDGYAENKKEYGYDNLNRLISEERNAIESAVWHYDEVGNWIYRDQNGIAETRTPNPDNEYTSITGITPVNDARGNMTGDGTRVYVYDRANRLVEVREGGQAVAQYTYDALNRRVTKYVVQNSLTTRYIYDGSQVIEEHENGLPARTYVYGLYVDDPLMMEISAGQSYLYLKDRQYSVTALANDTGQIIETYDYSAFGHMQMLD